MFCICCGRFKIYMKVRPETLDRIWCPHWPDLRILLEKYMLAMCFGLTWLIISKDNIKNNEEMRRNTYQKQIQEQISCAYSLENIKAIFIKHTK